MLGVVGLSGAEAETFYIYFIFVQEVNVYPGREEEAVVVCVTLAGFLAFSPVFLQLFADLRLAPLMIHASGAHVRASTPSPAPFALNIVTIWDVNFVGHVVAEWPIAHVTFRRWRRG